jgi:hypothetical protein
MIAIWEAQEMMEGAASKRPASHVAAIIFEARSSQISVTS